MTTGCRGLQEGLQRVTRVTEGYKGLQEVTGVTTGHRRLHGVTRGYRV